MVAQRITFIGLGIMGAPMARRLVAAGHDVTVCDTSTEVLAEFRRSGVATHASPGVAAKGANVVFTMLPTSAIVREVLFGEGGAAQVAADKAIFVDMSTGSLDACMEIGRALSTLGKSLIDAPVGRSRREADTGELLAMVGGQDADVAAVRPLLSCMASDIVHAGGPGKGLSLKLVNNYMAMVNHVLTAEVLALSMRAGLALDQTVAVLGSTSAGKGQLLTNFPRKVLAGDVSPDFPIAMGIKDLNMALDLCGAVDGQGRFARLARDIFQEASDGGFASYDCTGVLHFLEGRRPCDPFTKNAATERVGQ
tara:strand:- start:10 stop:936 length:927 start_codon:yes stop_codon:yes gene_type:complete